MILFSITFGVIITNEIFVIFPALNTPWNPEVDNEFPQPFTLGVWAIPFFVVNFFVLSLIVLVYTGNLPKKVENIFRYIINFEISKKVTIVLIVIIISGYIAFTVNDLTIDESEEWKDYGVVENAINNFASFEFDTKIKQRDSFYVENGLLLISRDSLDNVKILPYIASISLLLLTYLLTTQIAEKRLAGIVSLLILVSSSTFLVFDSTATYTNFWLTFYLAALFLMFRKWHLSPVGYVLSLFSKPLIIAFFPATLFFIARSKINSKDKTRLLVSYVFLIGALSAGALILVSWTGELLRLDVDEFAYAFTFWAHQLRFEPIIMLGILPLSFGLFLMSQRGHIHADSIQMLILNAILLAPLLEGLTGFNFQPYRMLPLVIFVSIGFGVLLSKRINRDKKSKG